MKGGVIIFDIDLGKYRVSNTLIKLSLPPMLGMIVYSILNIIDAYYVAYLGALEFAALTMTIPFSVFVASFASTLGIGIASLLGQALGRSEYAKANNIAWHGLILGMTLGIILVSFASANLDLVLTLLGCNYETLNLSRAYLSIIIIGYLFTFFIIIVGNVLQAQGNTFLPMLIAIIGVAIEVILDRVLIFGLGSIPALGLPGAAWASVISDIVSCLVLIYFIKAKSGLVAWNWRDFKADFRIIIAIHKIGIPLMLMEAVSVIMMVWFNRQIAMYGFFAVTVYGLFAKIRGLFLTPAIAITQGMMPLVAYAYGAGQGARIKECLVKALLFSTVLLIGAWFILQIFPDIIMSRFSDDQLLISMSRSGLKLATLFLPVVGVIWVFNATLQALGRGVSTMAFSILRQIIIFMPVVYVFKNMLGLPGIWIGIACTDIISAGCAFIGGAWLWKHVEARKKLPWSHWLKDGFILKRTAAWLRL